MFAVSWCCKDVGWICNCCFSSLWLRCEKNWSCDRFYRFKLFSTTSVFLRGWKRGQYSPIFHSQMLTQSTYMPVSYPFSAMRVLMRLTAIIVKEAKNLAVRRKNCQILTGSRKKSLPFKKISGDNNAMILTISRKMASVSTGSRKSHHPIETLWCL